MDIKTHSQLSVHKFGGNVEDYYEIHKFIDSSKLFYFNVKHRLLLHHTYGIDLCIKLFGDLILNANAEKVMVRDIAAEHLKEDLNGVIPTLNDWLEKNSNLCALLSEVENITDAELKKFVLQPYLMSGNESSLLITFSDFGVALTHKFLGMEKALMLRKLVDQKLTVKKLLRNFKFNQRWQFTPRMKELEKLSTIK